MTDTTAAPTSSTCYHWWWCRYINHHHKSRSLTYKPGIFTSNPPHTSFILSWHSEGVSEVSLPCVHLSTCAVAMAIIYSLVGLLSALRSSPDLSGALGNGVCAEKPVILTCRCTMQLFYLTVTSISSRLSLWQPYPRDLHLKLESSCPCIIFSWDRFLEYLGQTYPEGDTERRNRAGCHFWGWVHAYFELSTSQLYVSILSLRLELGLGLDHEFKVRECTFLLSLHDENLLIPILMCFITVVEFQAFLMLEKQLQIRGLYTYFQKQFQKCKQF